MSDRFGDIRSGVHGSYKSTVLFSSLSEGERHYIMSSSTQAEVSLSFWSGIHVIVGKLKVTLEGAEIQRVRRALAPEVHSLIDRLTLSQEDAEALRAIITLEALVDWRLTEDGMDRRIASMQPIEGRHRMAYSDAGRPMPREQSKIFATVSIYHLKMRHTNMRTSPFIDHKALYSRAAQRLLRDLCLPLDQVGVDDWRPNEQASA